MAGYISKVRSGDPFIMSATTFNTIADAVNDWCTRQRNIGRGQQGADLPAGVVLIRNDSGAPRAQFDVLGIGGAVLKPSDSVPLFAERVTLKGVAPTTADHSQRYAVLLEPVAAGAIGRARVDGICLTRVDMLDETHTQAAVKDGDPTQLQSCGSGGSAQLLWVEPEGDRLNSWAWAVVRLGAAGSPVLPVKVKQDGGVQGTETSQCTWTYSIYGSEDDVETATPLATDLTPEKARAAKGPYTKAPDGSYGLAMKKADGTWALLIAYGEVENLSDCDACA